jgi:complement component 1 Q subcomponent-binding protein, mitochondrial
LTTYVADLALSQKLAEEISYEREAAAQEAGEPEFLKAFKAQGTWQVTSDVCAGRYTFTDGASQVVENPGADEVTLTRKFGNET